MSACSFVSAELQDETKPLARQPVLEDVGIIESSLAFINELLRNMLDMQRASSNQLKIEKAPTDIKKDVLEPVDAMLYSRGSPFEIQVDCPDNLFVSTDRLRLKQIVINVRTTKRGHHVVVEVILYPYESTNPINFQSLGGIQQSLSTRALFDYEQRLLMEMCVFTSKIRAQAYQLRNKNSYSQSFRRALIP